MVDKGTLAYIFASEEEKKEMEVKHTDGPWAIDDRPESDWIFIEPDVAQLPKGGPSPANARLIAAASELLAALERLTEKVARANAIQHSGGRVRAEDWSELYALEQEARAAVNRARGVSA